MLGSLLFHSARLPWRYLVPLPGAPGKPFEPVLATSSEAKALLDELTGDEST